MAGLRKLRGKYYVRVFLPGGKEKLLPTKTGDKKRAEAFKRQVEEREFLVKAKLADDMTPTATALVEAVDAYVQNHEPDLSPLRRGNLAARLRSVILFDQSAKLGALPLGTGNKSERLLGYYTWHAAASPLSTPRGSLFTPRLWQLA